MKPHLIACKTQLGLDVVNNPNQDSLPRPLRLLLIMIDGKSSIERYQKLLATYSGQKNFGGVTNMLEALSELRLIELTDNGRVVHLNKNVQKAIPEPIASQKIIPDNFDHLGEKAIESSFQQLERSMVDDAHLIEECKQYLIEIIEKNDHLDAWELILKIESASCARSLMQQFESIWEVLKPTMERDERHNSLMHYNALKRVELVGAQSS